MPCPLRASITGNRLWGEVLIEKDLVDLPGDREPGLELADPALARISSICLVGAHALKLTTVDLLLVGPVVDGGFAGSERRSELLEARSRSSKLNHLTAHFWRVPPGHLSLSVPQDTRNPNPSIQR